MLCSCNAGYTGADSGASKGNCTTCPAGTYKSTNGSAACSLCPANTYSTAVQASSNSSCVACPLNAVAVPGSTGCLCSFGYTGNYASDQNLARSCGASGSEFCQASSRTFFTGDGIAFTAQFANDGVISDGFGDTAQDNPNHLRYISVRSVGRYTQTEWWQVDLSGQRDVKSVTIVAWVPGAVLLQHFDLQLSTDGITFTNCATDQDAWSQYPTPKQPPFISTHSCVGSARYVRLSMSMPDDEMLQLLEVQVYGTVPGTVYESCVACPAGKYKRVLGTSACIACPANTEAVAAGTTVCSSLAGFSGLGYALDDVARSCGVGLNETCKTLANGATSNAVGVDGALDANVNTFVSVAFNPNVARSCGSTGTQACVASISPVFSGASVLNGAANDGDTNTQAGSDYETARTPYIRPYWGVDFGQTKSVVAVKILTTSLAWQYLKDFKIVVGNAADAQSPLNAVCADYLTGAGSSYATFACEDTVSGRYLYIVNGPHAQNYLTLSEIAVESFNYTANPALMLPWWAVDFEVERAVAGIAVQTQASTTVQVRVGLSPDPLQNAVCANSTIIAGVNSTITCVTAMTGKYLFVIGPGNSVLTLNEVRVLGIGAAPCAAGTYKSLVGNNNSTACPALSTSVAGATSVGQCSCRAGYLDVWS